MDNKLNSGGAGSFTGRKNLAFTISTYNSNAWVVENF